jgi:hypothetical protein
LKHGLGGLGDFSDLKVMDKKSVLSGSSLKTCASDNKF